MRHPVFITSSSGFCLYEQICPPLLLYACQNCPLPYITGIHEACL